MCFQRGCIHHCTFVLRCSNMFTRESFPHAADVEIFFFVFVLCHRAESFTRMLQVIVSCTLQVLLQVLLLLQVLVSCCSSLLLARRHPRAAAAVLLGLRLCCSYHLLFHACATYFALRLMSCSCLACKRQPLEQLIATTLSQKCHHL